MNKKKFLSLCKIPKWAKGTAGIGKNIKTAKEMVSKKCDHVIGVFNSKGYDGMLYFKSMEAVPEIVCTAIVTVRFKYCPNCGDDLTEIVSELPKEFITEE